MAGDAREKHPGVKLLQPWFTDPDLEEEYRDAAYTLQVIGPFLLSLATSLCSFPCGELNPQRNSITRIIVVMSAVYLAVFIVELLLSLVTPDMEYSAFRVSYITLRVSLD